MDQGLSRRLTEYGDKDFALFLRRVTSIAAPLPPPEP